ncbi:MAG: DUF1302 family protein [Pseudomonadota bacterium]
MVQHLHFRLRLSVLVVAFACGANASALDTSVSGRVMFGTAIRTEAPDPQLLVSFNAAAIGLTGYANGGQNTDDANLNFRRGDASSRALKGYLDLSATEGAFSGLLRVKAWHDFALSDHERAWGNNANGYAAGVPLSDNGAARLSRFSGIALGDAYLQHSTTIGAAKIMTRLGQQSLAWGERAVFAGGLGAINAADQPAMRRAGAAPQELRRPAPMLFARAQISSAFSAEGFYTNTFRPSALDMCGTFWAVSDYLAEGCNRAYTGGPAASDRVRLANGYFLKRAPSPTANDGAQFGAALNWKPAALDAELGFYAARYIARTPLPGLYKSTRVGPALVANDPDGKNISYFTEYADDIKLYAFTFARKRGSTTWSGELAYRPNQPLMLPAGDVLLPFLNPNAPALLRADATATAPGAPFSGYDRHRAAQLQFGVQHDWGKVGFMGLAGSADVVVKHVMSLPDPALRRYGRFDQFGTGPVRGVCTVTSGDAARQCSFDGYVSPTAYGYRLRVDARLAPLTPGLTMTASATFVHDVKGWSYDLLQSEGRKSMNWALRFEYSQRYLAELAYVPVWGGRYSNQSDRDQFVMAVGVKF